MANTKTITSANAVFLLTINDLVALNESFFTKDSSNFGFNR